MNIFLTNDDGVDADGIRKLAQALRKKTEHRVVVIAPDGNRSGTSNAVSLFHTPVKLFEVEKDIWSCSGHPADCVILALLGALPLKPDLFLSGINRGENLGTDLIYSGTAAAARQASFMGVPAVALSLAGHGILHWDMAAAWVVDHLEELTAFWRKDSFVNVNIPNSPGGPEGMQEAWLAVKTYYDELSVVNTSDGSRWCFLQGEPGAQAKQKDSDCDVVSRNLVSISTVDIYPALRT